MVTKDPREPWGYLGLGKAARRRDQFEEAAKHLRKPLAFLPLALRLLAAQRRLAEVPACGNDATTVSTNPSTSNWSNMEPTARLVPGTLWPRRTIRRGKVDADVMSPFGPPAPRVPHPRRWTTAGCRALCGQRAWVRRLGSRRV